MVYSNCIAVDGMGGDYAPEVVVEGACLAAAELNVEIILTGRQAELKQVLDKYSHNSKEWAGRVKIEHASEVVGMEEPAAVSVRKKKDSSIAVAVRLVKEGKAQAVVTAGNTGAAVANTTLNLRLLPGIERPGIGVILPTSAGLSLLIDAGANIDAKPSHLLQYGLMGDVYMRHILGRSNPKIGLLNIGEEETKGTGFIKESFKGLNESSLNFIGNIEGKDIFTGKADVIVCDGFVGNIVLKVSESLAEAMTGFLKKELESSIMSRLGAFMCLGALRRLRKKTHYSEYGGAPLLGTNGICIISHGRSSAKAIKNAIRVASEFVNHQVNQHIIEALK